ncbi:MAG: SusC/RagA family TonB-linked outer membrane protein [Bacteroidales bacterium]|nr:SusC/RagA family TonB-linked outer membrane protein [Bacteroidales bacterium]
MKPLLTCLKSQIKFLLYAAFLTLFTCAPALAQERKVTGTVTSADDNSPMPGVNVIVQGKTTGTITDVNGNFSITVPGNEAVLVFSFIGYNAQEVVVGGQASINIKMATSATQLGEIVVTSLGIKRERKALTYSAQTVDVARLTESRELNAINSLQGKVAGLDLTRANAGVGSASRVVLRGNRSISGDNQPLYVVDGVPIQNSMFFTTYGEGGGMTSSDGISNINPDDIESVTVLKGPSATALYGTRASNGAILITTKKGKSGQGLGVEYNLNYSVESPVLFTKFQNVYGQGTGGTYVKNSEFDWGPKMDGQMVAHWTPDTNSDKFGTTYPFVAHPDNYKDFFQLGTNLTNTLAITSGKGDTQTYFSYTNTQSKGIVPGNELRRNNVNLRITTALSEKLSLDTKITYFHQAVDNRVSTGDDFSNPMRAILRQPSNISTAEAKNYKYYDNDGFLVQNYWNPHSNGGENPWWIVNMIPYTEARDRVLGMASLKYEIAKGLSLQIRSAVDYSSDSFQHKLYNDTYTIADRGRYYTNRQTNYEINNDALLNYNKTFGDISVNVSAGGNMLKQQWYGLYTTNGQALLKPNLFVVTNAANFAGSENGATKKLNSVYGMANIGFKNYLFLDLTARNDWSSTLPPDAWSYFYPSAGLTWVISDMFKTSMPSWFTFAKVRASFAQVGNDTDVYQLYPTFDFMTGGANGYASRSGTKPASDLKPEITTSQELGADIRFFQNRLGIDLTYYKSNSKNQLLSVNVPVASGYNSKFINAGNVQNKGIELTLNATPVKLNDFTWDLSINFAQNNSLVLELAEGMDRYNLTGRNWMTTTVIQVGHEYGEILTKKFLRNAEGRQIVNTLGMPMVTDGQTEYGGTYNPDWLGGLQSTFTYKAFDFNFAIDFRQGGVIYSFTEANLASDGFSDYTLEGRDGFIVDGVVQTKDANGNVISETENTTTITSEAYWQSLGGRNTPTGEPFAYDASNSRLRQAALGYTQHFKNGPVSSLRISVEGRNLFFLYNKAGRLDPNLSSGNTNVQGVEGFGLPSTRSFGMNLRVTF